MQVPQPDSGLMWDGDGARRGQDAEVLLWPPRSGVRERTAQRLAAEQRARQDEEYRRLLYVAMTRAEDRLYIAGYGTRRAAPETAWWNVVSRGLEPVAQPFAFESHPGGPDDYPDLAWQGDGLRLETPQTSGPDRKQGGDITAAHIPDLPDWADTPAPEEPEPPRPLAPSRPALPEPATRSPLGDDGGLAFQRGLLVHRLAADPARSRYSRPRGCRSGISGASRTCAGCRADRRADCRNDGRSGRSGLCGLFGPGSRAEVPVAGVVGGTAVSGRIDRLVIGPDGVKILDFKTNRPPRHSRKTYPLSICVKWRPIVHCCGKSIRINGLTVFWYGRTGRD